MPDDDIVTQPLRSLGESRSAPLEGDDPDTPQETSLMATAELRQILDASAEATKSGDTNVMALDEVAQVLGVSLTSRK